MMDRNIFTKLTEEELATLCQARRTDVLFEPTYLKALSLITEFEGVGMMEAIYGLIAVRVIEEYPDRALVERLQLGC